MAKQFSKNKWALFLLILSGIVAGSFLGYLTRGVNFLSWLNYGFDFSIGKSDGSNIVSLNLAVIVISFGLRIRITIGSVIGAVASVFIYKKL
jgi:hypothetical protein